jgi:hypothetical protein
MCEERALTISIAWKAGKELKKESVLFSFSRFQGEGVLLPSFSSERPRVLKKGETAEKHDERSYASQRRNAC